MYEYNTNTRTSCIHPILDVATTECCLAKERALYDTYCHKLEQQSNMERDKKL